MQRLLRRDKPAQPIGKLARGFLWAPVAILALLMLGIFKRNVTQNEFVLAAEATNPQTLSLTYERAKRIETDALSLSVNLAANPNTPAEILLQLAAHQDRFVRVEVARNPNTDLSVVTGMQSDCADGVRVVVHRRLTSTPEPEGGLPLPPHCGTRTSR